MRLGYMADDSAALSCVCAESYFFLVTIATFAVFAVAETIFLSCAAWTVWKINRHTAFTLRTKAMHAQMTRLLIAQVNVPQKV